MLLILFSVMSVSYSLQGQFTSDKNYSYPTLSSLDDISSYLSNMSSSPLPLASKPNTEMPLTGFFVTVYETSPGFKNLLYVTTYVQLRDGGKTDLQDLAGPVGIKLGTRKGQINFLSKDPQLLVFLHKEDISQQVFTNVLQILSRETGEIVTTQGNEYLKGYVRIERKSSNAAFPTN